VPYLAPLQHLMAVLTGAPGAGSTAAGGGAARRAAREAVPVGDGGCASSQRTQGSEPRRRERKGTP